MLRTTMRRASALVSIRVESLTLMALSNSPKSPNPASHLAKATFIKMRHHTDDVFAIGDEPENFLAHNPVYLAL
ncbi:hypothetical protein BJV77DRAFT_971059 [Russula vinacea]|nr:hypothetical protein BJV77DRAFT_971059 [Russula vinacea]